MAQLPSVTTNHVTVYGRSLAEKGAALATIERKTSSINKFLDWGKNKGYIEDRARLSLQSDQGLALKELAENIDSSSLHPARRGILFIATGATLLILLFLVTKRDQVIRLVQNFAKAPETNDISLRPPFSQSPPAGDSTTALPSATPTPTPYQPSILSDNGILSQDGPIKIEGTSVAIATIPFSNGNITVAPDAEGQFLIRSSTTAKNSIDIRNANLTTGDLIHGNVGNTGTNYNFLRFTNGPNETLHFKVDANGNTYIGGDADVAGNVSVGNGKKLLVTNIENKTGGPVTFHSTISFAESGTIQTASGNLTISPQNGILNIPVAIRNLTNTNGGKVFIDDALQVYGTINAQGISAHGKVQIDNGLEINGGDIQLVANSDIIPFSATGTNNIGSSTIPWDNIYADNVFAANITGIQGYWQRNAQVVSPTNITDDVLVGTVATPSASTTNYFQVFGSGSTAGDASSSGILTLGTNRSTAIIETERMIPLTLGSATTGPIQLSPKGTTGLFVDGTGLVGINTLTPSANLTVNGTLTQAGGAVSINDNSNNNVSIAGGTSTGTVTIGGGSETLKINLGSDATGDIFYRNSSGNVTRLGIGSVGQSLTVSAGLPSWAGGVGGTDGTVGWWQRNLGVLSPTNITDDLAVGGVGTSSALFQVFGNTGGATMSGTLTIGNGQTIRPAYGPLSLAYKSALNAWTTGVTLQDTTGNVGIGTTSPTVSLDIAQNAANIRLTSSGTNRTSLRFGNGSATDYSTGKDTSDNLHINRGTFTGQNTDFVLANTGNIGIGTTSPLEKLDVSGNATVSGNLTFSGATSTIANRKMQPITIGDSQTGPIQLSPKGTTGLFVDGTGNVGVGTTTPTSAFHVSGTSNLAGSVTLGTSTASNITFTGRVDSLVDPAGDILYDLGSSARRWNNIYAKVGNFTTISGTVAGGSTTSDDWTINSDNATADAENSTLTFDRGTAATNAQFKWDATNKYISTNTTFAIDPDTNITASGKAALIVNQPQAQDIFTASASGVPVFTIGRTGIISLNQNSQINTSGTLLIDSTGTLSLNTTNNQAITTGTGLTTLGGSLAVNGDTTLGNGITDNITFTGRVAQDSDLIPIGTTGTNDLGSTSLPWDNVYADNVYAINVNGTQGYWQRNSGALSPTNITDDVLIGVVATPSASTANYFQVFGSGSTAGDASTSGILTLGTNRSTAIIETERMIPLTLGSATTGPIQLSPKGTTGLFVDGAGNVGIGTTSPGGKLHIQTGSSGQSTAYSSGDELVIEGLGNAGLNILTPNTAIGRIVFGDNDSNARGIIAYNHSSDFLGFGAAGNDGGHLVINSSGNVGIGTTSPLEKLDVSGNATVSGNLTFYGGARTIQATAFNPLTIGGSTTGNITINPLNAVAGGYVAPAVTNVSDLGTSALAWRNLYVNNIYSPSTGISGYWQRNLGILAPTNITDDIAIGGTATSSALFQVFGNTGSATMSGTLTIGNGQTIRPAYGPLSLAYKSALNAWTTGITLQDTTGNVGIGTTSPGVKLDISLGGTSATGVQLLSGGATNFTSYSLGRTAGDGFWGVAGATGNYSNISTQGDVVFRADTEDLILAARNASGNIHLTTGSPDSAKVTVLSGGNVGIGTTSPSVELDLGGTNDNYDASMSGTLTIGNGDTIRPQFGPLSLAYKSALNAWTTGVTLQDTTGNVGIGTTSPGAKLQVVGAASAKTLLLKSNATTPDNALEVTDSTDTVKAFITSDGRMKLAGATMDLSTNLLDIGASANREFKVDANGITTVWNFYATGNTASVLIAASPGNLGMHVASTQNFVWSNSASDAFSGTYDLRLKRESAGVLGIADNTPTTGIKLGADGSAVFNEPGNSVDFRIEGDTDANLFFIKGSADMVGIGNAAPTEKLDVTGNATVSGNLTIGNGSTIRPAFGPLSLAYKSALNTWTTGVTLQDTTGNVGIGDTTPSKLFVVGDGDLFQVDSSGNIKGPTLALGTAAIAPTDRTVSITNSTALTNSTRYGTVLNQTFTGSLTGNTTSYGNYNTITTNVTDVNSVLTTIGIYGENTLSDGNTIDTLYGIEGVITNNSTTLSPTTSNTATSSAAVVGVARNSAAGTMTTQRGGFFDSSNNSTGAITTAIGSQNRAFNNNATGTIGNAYGSLSQAFTNVDGAVITTAVGAYGQALELTAQSTGGNTKSYGGLFEGEDATTSYGIYAIGRQNTANTESFTNMYGVYTDCQVNGANITVSNCYGVNANILESAGTITTGYGGYFNSAAAMGTGYGVYANLTGASTTSYGLYSNVTGAGTTNYGVYSVVSGAGTNYAGIFTGGNVGIGTITPAFRLHTSDAQAATVSAMIENTNITNDADGLAIKLGCTTTTCAANNYFAAFLDGGGRIFGKIQGTGASTVSYSSTGIDLAEYFAKDDPNAQFVTGTLMCQVDRGVSACTWEQPAIIGITSSAPAFLGGQEGPDKVIVALTGQVPVRISQTSNTIRSGDPLTISDEVGKAGKATKAGPIVGRALEDWDPASGKDTILAYISSSWYDPNVTASPFDSISRFIQLLAHTVQAEKIISPMAQIDHLAVDTISPIATSSAGIVVELGASQGFSLQSKENPSKPIASFDVTGNATLSATLYADRVVTNIGDVDERIELLEASLSARQSEITEPLDTPVTLDATSSALLALGVQSNDNNPTLTLTKPIVISSNLSVLGDTTLGRTTIAGSLLVDGSIRLATSSIDTISDTLFIQKSKFADVDIMNGALVVTPAGNVLVNGNLTVTGTLAASVISPIGNNDLVIDLVHSATPSSVIPDLIGDPSTMDSRLRGNDNITGFGKFIIRGANNILAASIDAGGTATFAGELTTSKLIIADSAVAQSPQSDVTQSNAIIGKGNLQAGTLTADITTTKVTNNSFIYITPITSTSNTVLYVKSKNEGSGFTVAVDQPVVSDILFNWWIVN